MEITRAEVVIKTSAAFEGSSFGTCFAKKTAVKKILQQGES